MSRKPESPTIQYRSDLDVKLKPAVFITRRIAEIFVKTVNDSESPNYREAKAIPRGSAGWYVTYKRGDGSPWAIMEYEVSTEFLPWRD